MDRQTGRVLTHGQQIDDHVGSLEAVEAGVVAGRQSGSTVDEQHDTANAQNPKPSYKDIHFVLNIQKTRSDSDSHPKKVKLKPIPTTQQLHSAAVECNPGDYRLNIMEILVVDSYTIFSCPVIILRIK